MLLDFLYKISFIRYGYFTALYSDKDHIMYIKDIEYEVLKGNNQTYESNLYKIAAHLSYIQDDKILSNFLATNSFVKEHAKEIFDISFSFRSNKMLRDSMIVNSFEINNPEVQHQIFKLAADKHMPDIAAFMIKIDKADVLAADIELFKSDKHAIKVISSAIKDKIAEDNISLDFIEKQLKHIEEAEVFNLQESYKNIKNQVNLYTECLKMADAYLNNTNYVPVIVNYEDKFIIEASKSDDLDNNSIKDSDIVLNIENDPANAGHQPKVEPEADIFSDSNISNVQDDKIENQDLYMNSEVNNLDVLSNNDTISSPVDDIIVVDAINEQNRDIIDDYII